jgi:hypothetical protein
MIRNVVGDAPRGISGSTEYGQFTESGRGYRSSVIALVYWAAWVAFGLWSFGFLFAYRRDALWMVLAVFLFTQGDILPAHRVSRPLRVPTLLLASLACAMLLYDTSDWWFSVFESWHSSSRDAWVRQTLGRLWFVSMYILGTMVTAGMLVLPFKRALGEFAVVAIATFGTFITVWVQRDFILSSAAWHHDWLVSAFLLFRALIVGLGVAAIAQRVRSPAQPDDRPPLWRRLWGGKISVPGGMVIYLASIIASLALLVFVGFSYNARGPDGSLQVGKQLLCVFVGEMLPCLLFFAGSMIVLRTLGEAAVHRRPLLSRFAQVLVLLCLIPVVVTVARSNAFVAGEKLRSSLAVVLGTAYSYRLTADGSGLAFNGDVTYGVADRLKRELGLHPTVRRLILSSGGGLTSEAVAAADIIADAKLDTVVEQSCASACVLLFLAGTQRTVIAPGKLGFHAFVALNPVGDNGIIGSCGEYARSGVTMDFCRKVDAVVPPAMWYPTQEELVAAHVIAVPTRSAR